MPKATKTPEQKAAEALEKLKVKASEFGVEFTEETTADELAALVEEAKENAKAAKAPAAKAEPKKKKQTSFEVLNVNGVPIRTYSVETHGEEAETRAKEYAKKINGSVK